MTNYPDDNTSVTCKVCNSDDVEEISMDEEKYALGLFQIHQFLGQIDTLGNAYTYRCRSCGNMWQ